MSNNALAEMAPSQHGVVAIGVAVTAVALVTLWYLKRAASASSSQAANAKPAVQKSGDASKKVPPTKKTEESDESDSDDETGGMDHEIWKRVEDVLREFALSRLGMAAAKKWVKMMIL